MFSWIIIGLFLFLTLIYLWNYQQNTNQQNTNQQNTTPQDSLSKTFLEDLFLQDIVTITMTGGFAGRYDILEIKNNMSYTLFNENKKIKEGTLANDQQKSLNYLIDHLKDNPLDCKSVNSNFVSDGTKVSVKLNNQIILSYETGDTVPDEINKHILILEDLFFQKSLGEEK